MEHVPYKRYRESAAKLVAKATSPYRQAKSTVVGLVCFERSSIRAPRYTYPRNSIYQEYETAQFTIANAPILHQSRRHLCRGLRVAGFLERPWRIRRSAYAYARANRGAVLPRPLPLDTDNDLIIVNDNITPAIGEITHLSGRILDSKGEPIRNAVVEIWQVDGNGVYLTRATGTKARRQFPRLRSLPDRQHGRLLLPDLKPVAYPGRTPHIHFMIKRPKMEEFTTQCYIKGNPQNERDGVYRGIRDAKGSRIRDDRFQADQGSKTGELEARFDIVLGVTPRQS